MTKPIALIVDDEPDILELLTITLSRMDINCVTSANVVDAKSNIEKTHFDLCLTDMRLPDGNGIEIVDAIQQVQPDTPVAVITAHGNMETAIEAMKRGAFDFISKPVNLSYLRSIITSALDASSRSQKTKKSPLTSLIGETESMKRLKHLILKVAKSQAPVFISGESGTGKELVARLIHKQSARSKAPFIAINCGAIPSELMESELFGHKKGSFTGATSDKIGIFESADSGTLFLDEIADLPMSMQVKLLRAIQERRVRPVGGVDEKTINVRLLSASHKNLTDLIEQGLFRRDLYYRLNVIEIPVPPLRNRLEDLPALIDNIIRRIAHRNEIDTPKVDESLIKHLARYEFPGNVRELENILERALALSNDNNLSGDDIILPQNEGRAQVDHGLSRNNQPLDDYLSEIEKKEIEEALIKSNGNKTAAAEILGISFRTMRYKCKKLNIN